MDPQPCSSIPYTRYHEQDQGGGGEYPGYVARLRIRSASSAPPHSVQGPTYLVEDVEVLLERVSSCRYCSIVRLIDDRVPTVQVHGPLQDRRHLAHLSHLQPESLPAADVAFFRNQDRAWGTILKAHGRRSDGDAISVVVDIMGCDDRPRERVVEVRQTSGERSRLPGTGTPLERVRRDLSLDLSLFGESWDTVSSARRSMFHLLQRGRRKQMGQIG